MATLEREFDAVVAPNAPEVTNGAAMAAYLAAGFGAFATGLIVLLNEVGILVVPALYAPAGGVSGRTTLAIVLWLVVWGTLHARWNDRDVAPGRVGIATLILIALGILGTFPPFWTVVQ